MSTNQEINVSGESNTVRVFGSGKGGVGNQSIEVSGAGNSVVVASSGDLRIGGTPKHRKKPPKVCRGQIWQHNIMARRFQVISVRNNVARCLVTDAHGKPITGKSGAMIQDIATINLRYAWRLIN